MSGDRREISDSREVRNGGLTVAVGLVLLGLMLTLAYAFVVPAGTASDEPSHYHTVLYYATNRQMPVLGRPGVDYEAQMGPVYYALAAVTWGLMHPFGDRMAFYSLRVENALVGALLLLAIFLAARQWAGRWAIPLLAVTALAPTLAAINASIQNDTLVLLFGTAAIAGAGKWDVDDAWSGAAVGALVGVGMLTKSSAILLVPALPLMLLVRNRRPPSLRWLTAFLGVAIVLSGWWFLRNISLYGDLTAQAALTRYAYHNNPPPLPIWHLSNLFHWLYGIVAYAWAPTEYFRDVFRLPISLRVLIILVSGIGAIGVAFAAVRHELTNRSLLALAVLNIAALAVYAYSTARITYFAPRTIFVVLPWMVVFLLIGGERVVRIITRRSTSAYTTLVLASLLILNAYELYQLSHLPRYPFNIAL